jgi:hypothetical protein
MAEMYANFCRQKEVEKQNREKFLEEGVKELKYHDKKYTKKGVIFYQTPESTPKSSFPHVEIHVPGLKPVGGFEEDLKSPEKRRNFGRKESGEMDRKREKVEKKEALKLGEMKNARFTGKK